MKIINIAKIAFGLLCAPLICFNFLFLFKSFVSSITPYY